METYQSFFIGKGKMQSKACTCLVPVTYYYPVIYCIFNKFFFKFAESNIYRHDGQFYANKNYTL